MADGDSNETGTMNDDDDDDNMDLTTDGELFSYLAQELDPHSEYLDTIAQMANPPDAEYFLSGGVGNLVPYSEDERQAVKLEVHGVFEEHLLACVQQGAGRSESDLFRRSLCESRSGHPASIDQDSVGCWVVGGTEPQALIEKDLPMLTPSEMEKYKPQVHAACLEELREWIRLCGLTRRPRRTANNIVDMRWVVKWKLIDGKRAVRCRMPARDFKDKMKEDVDAYSGTASRWGQRAVTATAAM